MNKYLILTLISSTLINVISCTSMNDKINDPQINGYLLFRNTDEFKAKVQEDKINFLNVYKLIEFKRNSVSKKNETIPLSIKYHTLCSIGDWYFINSGNPNKLNNMPLAGYFYNPQKKQLTERKLPYIINVKKKQLIRH